MGNRQPTSLYEGTDVSKTTLDTPSNGLIGQLTVSNDPDGFVRIIDELRKPSGALILNKATSGFVSGVTSQLPAD